MTPGCHRSSASTPCVRARATLTSWYPCNPATVVPANRHSTSWLTSVRYHSTSAVHWGVGAQVPPTPVLQDCSGRNPGLPARAYPATGLVNW